MKYETAGDPISGMKWTRKTTARISDELAKAKIYISKTTVGKILKKLNFSLKTNKKTISNGGKIQSKEQRQARDTQFIYMDSMRDKFHSTKEPVIWADTKKKEPIGNFKNPGTRLKSTADLTYDHDFITYALGKAIPYGILDEANKQGFVAIGMNIKEGNKFTSGDTPEFAVESIEKWWKTSGRKSYNGSRKLLIFVDAGGSNSYRNKMWKVFIQRILCDRHGLTVTVCHYPPGASKWNHCDHRLFSEITKNWRGTPLIDWETILKYTRNTKTTTGLRVRATMVKKQYKTGIKAPDNYIDSINIKHHEVNSNWNYTISPTSSN